MKLLFNDTYSYPRLFEMYYKTLEEFVEGLKMFESKVEETFAEHPGYTMEMKSFVLGKKGYIIQIKVNKVKK